MNVELEKELVKLFVRSEKRERVLMFAGKTKSRPKLLAELNGPGIFNQKLLTKFTGSQRTLANLISEYTKLGMGPDLYVISENSAWDGCTIPKSHILEATLFESTDTLGYCPKSRTAFYEWHHGETSFFLIKSK